MPNSLDDLIGCDFLGIIDSDAIQKPLATTSSGAQHAQHLVRLRGVFVMPRTEEGFTDISKLPPKEERSKVTDIHELIKLLAANKIIKLG